MKTGIVLRLLAVTLTAVVALLIMAPARAATTVDPANKYGYGANLGWMNWRGDINHGAVIGEYVCSGYIWAANVGWIHLGDGSPANGIHYQNNTAADYGINHDGLGHLRGLAYGANVGWINFEPIGNPRLDLMTGKFSGLVYSANCGWIGLSNVFAHVQTDSIRPGADTDGDGIADGWELSHTNTLAAFDDSSDTDGDGASDAAEYGADTDPLDPNDYLHITAYLTQFGGGNETNALEWTSQQTRFYILAYQTNLASGTPWMDATGLIAPDPGATTARMLILSGAPLMQRYFRVEAIKPLQP